jgi:hypothetical protein
LVLRKRLENADIARSNEPGLANTVEPALPGQDDKNLVFMVIVRSRPRFGLHSDRAARERGSRVALRDWSGLKTYGYVR